MRTKNFFGFLFLAGLLVFVCGAGQPPGAALELTRNVSEKEVVIPISQSAATVDIAPGITLPVPRSKHTATRLTEI